MYIFSIVFIVSFISTIMKYTLFVVSLFVFLFLLFALFPVHAETLGSGYWHTNGNKILDANNQQVRFAGVNWFGLETGSFAPHGLWARNYREMMDQMKQLGFNTIRLPFSNDVLNTANKPGGIDYGKNPDLQGLSGLQVLDKVVEYANKIGMKVILDRHRPTKDGQSELWYTSSVSESKWIEDWKSLVRRYKDNAAVIAVDLHNEPHGAACWGCGDTARDWKLAAERAGNAVLSENNNLLIIVEGIQTYGSHWYWWGGNLEGVKNAQVNLSVPNRLVYSTHDYPHSVWNQSWFNDSNYPNNLSALWDMIWGNVHKTNNAPVLVGEFGSKLETQKDQQWYDALTAYIKSNNLSWTYWSWNPNSGDTGGILADDWKSVNMNKINKLSSIQLALDSTVSLVVPSSTLQPTATPTAKPVVPILTQVSPTSVPTIPVSPSVTSTKTISCKVTYSVTQSWNNDGFTAEVRIQNTGSQPIQGWKVAWSYAGSQQVKNLWNGSGSQTGNSVLVSNVDWNKDIQPNNTVTFGFVGSYSGSNQNPSSFKLNDTQCQ